MPLYVVGVPFLTRADPRHRLPLEFIGSADGIAAPRLAETRPDRRTAGECTRLAQRAVTLARDGLAHGDRPAMPVHDGRIVMIDLPQVVDVIANRRLAFFLNP